jgi:hypothetical protein
MRRSIVARGGVALLSLFGLARTATADEAINLGAGQKMLAPITFRQLTVFPIVQNAVAVDRTQYLTLTEGVKKKLVTVSELGGGGNVNALNVHNKSDRTLLILGGEVVLGGQQDRVLGQDTLIPPHEQMRVQVFCVEHGRWSGGRQFSAAEGMADTKIRMRAKYMGDQSQVWAEVAKKNAAHGAAPSTGTYRNLATGEEGKRALDPYRKAVGMALNKLPERDKLVGVVAAVNGRVTSVEMFAKPELFSAYRDKLLDSIFMGAADSPVDEKAPPAKAADVGVFLKKAKVSAPQQVSETKAGKTIQFKGDGVNNSTLAPAAPTAQPVYESYQKAE